MEYHREGKCDNCLCTEWQGPVMECIPRLFPREGHYLDVFSAPKTNEDSSPREIDDFLLRAQVKKPFAKGELHGSDKAKLAERSKELCVEDSVKHCEQLQVFSEMKSRKRNQKKEERDAKVYKDYDWADRIRSGSLVKLAVKGLDKYTDHHHLQCKYLSKEDKIQCKTHHYYSTTGVHKQQSEDSADSSDEDDKEESEDGEDIVLNEIGEEESEESEAEQVSFTRSETSTGNKRRMDSDWLFY